jgi:predicted DsbA family dithiol-disulfide isomerase
MAWRTPARTHSSINVAQKRAATSPTVSIGSIVASVRVDIWSDVICPWCYIGKRRFDTAVTNLRARGITDAIDVTFRSYQLDPTAPMDHTSPVIEAYAKKFGGQETAERIINHVTSVAAADGIEFHMDIAQRANTMHAHRALHYALTEYGSDTQALLKQELLQAYFTDGENVGDITVISQRASQVGIDTDALHQWMTSDNGYDAVTDDIRAASARDITAVPSFVINDQFLIPGAQDVQVFENILERVLTRSQ